MTIAEGLSIGCALLVILLASRQLATLYRVIDVDLDVLLDTRRPGDRRESPLLGRLASDSESVWLRDLCAALSEPAGAKRIVACDEALSDIEGAISSRARLPSDALRLAIFSALFCLALLVIRREATPESLGNVVAMGAGSVMVALHLRHRTAQRDTADRRALDRWVSAWTTPDEREGEVASVLSRPRSGTRVDSGRLGARRTDRGSRVGRR
ncbi:MAG: hypothetical protein U0165_13790 [Polyangiaceae bacterium]